MKAEHRKELETNSLADTMGQAVRNLRTRPRRRMLIYGALVIGAALAIFLTYRWWNLRKEENTQRWYFLADGSRSAILALVDNSPGSNPAGVSAAAANPGSAAGKAAALQLAWFEYWRSFQMLGGQKPGDALKQLKQLGEVRYPELAKMCAGDETFEPETLYFQAVIEETRSVEDIKRLDSAKSMYEKLANEKYGKSAFGQRAAERTALLNDPEKSKDVRQLYQDLKVGLGIRAAGRGDDFPDFHDLFKKKK